MNLIGQNKYSAKENQSDYDYNQCVSGNMPSLVTELDFSIGKLLCPGSVCHISSQNSEKRN